MSTPPAGRQRARRGSPMDSPLRQPARTIRPLEDLDESPSRRRSSGLLMTIPPHNDLEDELPEPPPRRTLSVVCKDIISNKWFDRAVIVAILINCVFLALYDPLDSDPNSADNVMLFNAEFAFIIIFSLEMLVKIAALGFVRGKEAYLRDHWNRLDFVIVLVGYIGLLDLGTGGVSVIRTLRVLRPLRTLSHIGGLRVLVEGLLSSLPRLLDVFTLCVLLFALFGIFAVQMWAGVLRQRCVSDATGALLYAPEENQLCSLDPSHGGVACPAGYTCRHTAHNPNYGITTFDNTAFSFLIIFQTITMEGYSDIMYMLQDALNDWVVVYFVALVFIGGFFVVNLALAVIYDNFAMSAADARGQAIEDAITASEDAERLKFMDGVDVETMHVPGAHLPQSPMSMRRTVKLTENTDWESRATDAVRRAGNTVWESVLCYPCRPRHRSYEPNAVVSGCKRVIEHDAFEVFIFLCIFVNTIFLAIEHHRQSQALSDFLEVANLTLTLIFSVEMVLKLIGMGVYAYVHSTFDLFDGTIVIISWLEVAFASGSGGLTAFRAFRLGRVLKLVRSLESLHDLLQIIWECAVSVREFPVLLFLFLFIYCVLGMQLFGGTFNFPEVDGGVPRVNFDSFSWSFIATFQVLTREDWPQLMFYSVRATSPAAILFYVTLIVMGTYIILNLFVAILIEKFAAKRKEAVARFHEKLSAAAKASTYLRKGTTAIAGRARSLSRYVANAAKKKTGRRSTRVSAMRHSDSGDSGTSRSDTNSMRTQRGSLASSESGGSMLEVNHHVHHHEHQPPRRMRTMPVNGAHASVGASGVNGGQDASTDAQSNGSSRENGYHAAASLAVLEPVATQPQPQPTSIPVQKFKRYDDDELDERGVIRKAPTLADLTAQMQGDDTVAKQAEEANGHKCEGVALGVLTLDNPLRKACIDLINHKWFDRAILLAILVSTILLALDEPNLANDSVLAQTLSAFDIAFVVIFGVEMVVKIIALGLVRGPSTYLRNSWNVLDCFIVIISILDLFLSGLKAFRSFRALRALRPLRVISRNEGMRVVVNSIFRAIPTIGNAALVCLFFFLIFGILGVQLYAGKFYTCSDPSVTLETACTGMFNATVDGMTTLQERRWINAPSHFDDILQAELTLFEAASGEGWVEVLLNVVDATEVGRAPVENHNMWNALFMITFISIGSFFLVNLFVGVVIDAFTKIKMDFNMKSVLLSEAQLQWVVQASTMMNQTKPMQSLQRPQNKLRARAFAWCMNRVFDSVIMVCIVINVIFMATRHYAMSPEWSLTLEISNIVFTVIFSIELVLKMVALYPRKYMSDPWNKLDFVIVVGSWLGILFDVGSAAAILRVFRISRVLRLVRQAKGLRTLLRTLYIAAPSLLNIGTLLFLLFFVYAVLGMNLFGKVVRQEFLSRHANFETFGSSMLLLFRMSTGEGWNGFMRDCMVQPPFCDPAKDECGDPVLSAIFFVTFVVSVTFVVLNLIVAVMLEVYDNMRRQDDNQVISELRDRFSTLWSLYDPEATGRIGSDRLLPMLEELGEPLGIDASLSRKDKLLALAEYDIPTDSQGNVMFKPTELALLEHASAQSHDFSMDAMPEEIRKQLKNTAVVSGANRSSFIRRRNTSDSLVSLSQYTQAELYAASIIIANWKEISRRRRERRERHASRIAQGMNAEEAAALEDQEAQEEGKGRERWLKARTTLKILSPFLGSVAEEDETSVMAVEDEMVEEGQLDAGPVDGEAERMEEEAEEEEEEEVGEEEEEEIRGEDNV